MLMFVTYKLGTLTRWKIACLECGIWGQFYSKIQLQYKFIKKHHKNRSRKM